jgi:hypothetical protein
MDESTFNCPHCGTLYTVTVGRRVTTAEESARCKVCDRVMLQWSTASPPTFRLMRDPRTETSQQSEHACERDYLGKRAAHG